MLDIVGVAFLVLWLLVAALFSYSAYWAFNIRRALMHYLYKRQALWAGLMASYFVALATFLTIVIAFNINLLAVNISGGFLIASGFVVIFLWIDSTISVARRSDPLYRDSLKWSKLRYLFGAVTVFGAIGAVLNAIYSGLAAAAPFGGALFFGAIALFLSAARSGDPTLRRHLKWTGLCIFLLWLSSQLVNVLEKIITDTTLSQAITFSLVALGALALYKSTRSLARVEHLPTIGATPSQISGSSLTSSASSAPQS